MRKVILSLLIAAGLLIGFVPAPASGHTLTDPDNYDYHMNCPNGVTLYFGGGGGVKHMWNLAADHWNEHAKANARYPKIVKRVEANWDGKVWGYNAGAAPSPCIIDTDEQFKIEGYETSAGIGGISREFVNFVGLNSKSNHYRSGFGLFAGQYWGGGDIYDRHTAVHELGHAMGMGHTDFHPGQENSFMWSGQAWAGNDWWLDDNWRAANDIFDHGH